MNFEDIPFFKEYSEIKGVDIMKKFVLQLIELGHEEDAVKGFVRNSYRNYMSEMRKHND